MKLRIRAIRTISSQPSKRAKSSAPKTRHSPWIFPLRGQKKGLDGKKRVGEPQNAIALARRRAGGKEEAEQLEGYPSPCNGKVCALMGGGVSGGWLIFLRIDPIRRLPPAWALAGKKKGPAFGQGGCRYLRSRSSVVFFSPIS